MLINSGQVRRRDVGISAVYVAAMVALLGITTADADLPVAVNVVVVLLYLLPVGDGVLVGYHVNQRWVLWLPAIIFAVGIPLLVGIVAVQDPVPDGQGAMGLLFIPAFSLLGLGGGLYSEQRAPIVAGRALRA